mgnify:CR=1 FL=1
MPMIFSFLCIAAIDRHLITFIEEAMKKGIVTQPSFYQPDCVYHLDHIHPGLVAHVAGPSGLQTSQKTVGQMSGIPIDQTSGTNTGQISKNITSEVSWTIAGQRPQTVSGQASAVVTARPSLSHEEHNAAKAPGPTGVSAANGKVFKLHRCSCLLTYLDCKYTTLTTC